MSRIILPILRADAVDMSAILWFGRSTRRSFWVISAGLALLSACAQQVPPRAIQLTDIQSIIVGVEAIEPKNFTPREAWNLTDTYRGAPISTLVAREGAMEIDASPLFPLVLNIGTVGFRAPRQRRIDIRWDGKRIARLAVTRRSQTHQLFIPTWRLRENQHTLSLRSVNETPGQRGRHTGYLLINEIHPTSGLLRNCIGLEEPFVLSPGENVVMFFPSSQEQWLSLTARALDQPLALETNVFSDIGEGKQLEPFTVGRRRRTDWLNWSWHATGQRRHRITIGPTGGTVEIALSQIGWDPPLAAACGMVYRTTAPVSTKSPVVVILLDALRADRWGAVEYGRSLTPHLDILAKEGVLFRRCRCHVPYTSGSLPTILTGRYPRSDGHVAEGKASLSIAQMLREHGYVTVAISANPFLVPGTDAARGFDMVLDIESWRRAQGISEPSYWGHHFLNPLREVLFQVGNQPFFLFLHLMQPHEPYSPPAPFDTIGAALESGRLGNIEPFSPGPLMRLDLTPPEIDYVRARYDANVRYGDYVVGQILDVLRQFSPGVDPILVVTADHGEALMEHGTLGHSDGRLYEENLIVPLLFSGQGLQGGETMDAVIELVDLAPTVLDMVDCPAPGMDGRSLVGVMTGAQEPKPGPFFAVSRPFRDYPHRVASYQPPWKYIMAEKQEELFHLESDFAESENIADVHPDLCSVFRKTCRAWLTDDFPHAVPDATLLSDEERHKLEILGYIAQ